MSNNKTNLKDAYGLAKSPVNNIPSVALFALGAAMADGARKYTPFNWREAQVKASIFFDANQRHAWDWWEGEDFAPDSLVHHLAHQMACCAIILDAIQQGNFIDDRPEIKNIGASRNIIWKKVKDGKDNETVLQASTPTERATGSLPTPVSGVRLSKD